MNLKHVIDEFRSKGATRVLVKYLAPQDNSKNQPYFGGADFFSEKPIPFGEPKVDRTGNAPKLKAPLDFYWLGRQGTFEQAVGAQLILYPQYPEVRFSAFLRGCRNAPSDVMTVRDPGRVLLLGMTRDARILGFAAVASDPVAKELQAMRPQLRAVGVFHEVPLTGLDSDTEHALLVKLGEISLMGWIESRRLAADGDIIPCKAPQCGGYTLEALLGIMPNSRTAPDYLGWEIKSHTVVSLPNPERGSGAITLMTPEPTGGTYVSKGVEFFVRTYGYKDRRGRQDRLNFGGVHRAGELHRVTGLELRIEGADPSTFSLVDPGGGLYLYDRLGEVVASWGFASLIRHWHRKHSRAAYVPNQKSGGERLMYRFGNLVRLGVRSPFDLLLHAIGTGKVYYDPAIKLERADSASPTIKRRSQWRIRCSEVGDLYEEWRIATVITQQASGTGDLFGNRSG